MYNHWTSWAELLELSRRIDLQNIQVMSMSAAAKWLLRKCRLKFFTGLISTADKTTLNNISVWAPVSIGDRIFFASGRNKSFGGRPIPTLLDYIWRFSGQTLRASCSSGKSWNFLELSVDEYPQLSGYFPKLSGKSLLFVYISFELELYRVKLHCAFGCWNGVAKPVEIAEKIIFYNFVFKSSCFSNLNSCLSLVWFGNVILMFLVKFWPI